MTLRVAIVSRDADVRAAAARAFAAAPAEWTVELSYEPVDADVVVRGPDVPAAGGIHFDPARPEDALRAVAAAGAQARTYVVVGAAGGVGATTVALHLAAALDAGSCYAELGPQPDRLGLPGDARTWLPRDEDVAAAALPVAGGFRVLRAPRPCPPPAAFPLRAAGAAFRRLVLDAGTCDDVEDVVAAAAAALCVTTPTRPAALATRSLVERFPDARWVVVVNRVGPGGQIMRSALEQLLGRAVTVELPCCAALRVAEDQARLLAGTWRRWTRGVARLAAALERC
jgi:hypothetical protein